MLRGRNGSRQILHFINVVLSNILTNYTRDDLDNVVNQVLSFT